MPARKWIDDGYLSTDVRDLSAIRRVLIVTMLLNFASTIIKLVAGITTGALSVVADAFDSLFDGLSNIAGLIGLNAASKPPDAGHPYGHRKFETIAALSIAFLLFLTSWQLLQTAWQRWRLDAVPDVTIWTGLAMVAGMLIQAVTSYYELRQGRKLDSEILIADALHTRASILVSFSVLGGLGLVRLGFPRADPLLAAFVAIMIAKIGIDIIRENLPVLVDQAALEPGRIAAVVEDIAGIESFHRVRSRGAAGSAAIDLHIRVSPEKTVQEANAIADEVRRRLLRLQGVSDVTVHIEAQRKPEREAADYFATVKQAAAELSLVVHEIWAHKQGEGLFLDMHVGVEPQLTLGEAHDLVDRLEREIQLRLPMIREVHTHIELATSRIEDGNDKILNEEDKMFREVHEAITMFPSLSHPHNLRLRRNPADQNKLYLSLECFMAPEIPITQAHDLASQLERELSRRLPEVANVSVHLEPPETD